MFVAITQIKLPLLHFLVYAPARANRSLPLSNRPEGIETGNWKNGSGDSRLKQVDLGSGPLPAARLDARDSGSVGPGS